MSEGLNRKYPNKTAFITGAGSGLGKAFATNLASLGWKLHLSDIDEVALLETCKSLPRATEVHTYQLDVSSLESYQQVRGKVMDKSSSLDVLINNAGIGDGGLFQDYDFESWRRMLNVNLVGVANGCHLFVPQMVEKQSGTIINVGSAAGFMNAPGMSAYNVSKAGVYALSETLYHELKSENIHVSVLTPTFFKTNVMKNAQGSDAVKSFAEKQMKYSKTNAEEVARLTLDLAGRKKFQIIHPAEARRSHFLKKWFPQLIERQYAQMKLKLLRPSKATGSRY